AAVEEGLEVCGVSHAGQAQRGRALAQPDAGRLAGEGVVELDLPGDCAPEVVVRVEQLADANYDSHTGRPGCHNGCHDHPRIADASSWALLGMGFVSLR